MTDRRQDADAGETFTQVVRDLLARTGESQKQFAARYNVARSTVAENLRGVLHTENLKLGLIKDFPDDRERIEAAYDRALDEDQPTPKSRRNVGLKRKIEDFLATGRYPYAERALRQGLRDARDDAERYWMLTRLYVALRALQREPEAIEALTSAVETATVADLQAEELESRGRLAGRYQGKGEYARAHGIVDLGLLRYPRSERLWLRKGKILWYERAYPEAYAALTTSRRYGASLTSVLHARGQVLAEWGSFKAALADIDEYLTKVKATSEVNIVYARGARAYVWGQTGRLPEALAEFAELEALAPGWALLHYRRALCYFAAGEDELGVADLRAALRLTEPGLGRMSRADTIALLEQYGAKPELD